MTAPWRNSTGRPIKKQNLFDWVCLLSSVVWGIQTLYLVSGKTPITGYQTIWRSRFALEKSLMRQTDNLWWCSFWLCGVKSRIFADVALVLNAKHGRDSMGNIHCCVLPSPRGGPTVKNEPYDRTGHANETFELPHISDREGSSEQIVCESVIGLYSGAWTKARRRANWMIDVFFPLIFFLRSLKPQGDVILT